MRLSKLSTLVIALLLVTALVAGCAPRDRAPAGDEPKYGGTVRVAVIGNPPTLDVMRTTATITLNIMWHVHEQLFTMDEGYTPIPHLVDTYDISPDNTTYTFRLRQGVRFHDGSEMTADDVVASLERWGKLATQGRALFAVKQSLIAKDRYTVELMLTESVAITPLYLTGNQASIMPKAVIDAAGDGEVPKFIGTGPYEFVEFEPDRHVKLKRFEQYSALPGGPNGYGGTRCPYADEILFIPVPDAAVRVAGVQAGDYHFGEWITPDEYERLKVIPELGTVIVKPSGWTTAVFNKKAGLFTDKLMRQAFLAALDMEPIMKAAYGHPDFWRVDPGIMMKEQAMWTDAGGQWYNQNNPERARQLLQQAGYDGTPVRWVTTTEYPAYYTTALVSKTQLERAGFVIDLQVVDWATVVERRAKPETYDVFSTAFGTTWDPVLLLCLSPTWPGWYESDAMQDLVGKMRRETDPDKRYALWQQAQALFWEDVPVIKYGDYFNFHIHRVSLRGYAGMQATFYWNVWLD